MILPHVEVELNHPSTPTIVEKNEAVPKRKRPARTRGTKRYLGVGKTVRTRYWERETLQLACVLLASYDQLVHPEPERLKPIRRQ